MSNPLFLVSLTWTRLVCSQASVGDTSASMYSNMSILNDGFNVMWGTSSISSSASSSVASQFNSVCTLRPQFRNRTSEIPRARIANVTTTKTTAVMVTLHKKTRLTFSIRERERFKTIFRQITTSWNLTDILDNLISTKDFPSNRIIMPFDRIFLTIFQDKEFPSISRLFWNKFVGRLYLF